MVVGIQIDGRFGHATGPHAEFEFYRDLGPLSVAYLKKKFEVPEVLHARY